MSDFFSSDSNPTDESPRSETIDVNVLERIESDLIGFGWCSEGMDTDERKESPRTGLPCRSDGMDDSDSDLIGCELRMEGIEPIDSDRRGEPLCNDGIDCVSENSLVWADAPGISPKLTDLDLSFGREKRRSRRGGRCLRSEALPEEDGAAGRCSKTPLDEALL